MNNYTKGEWKVSGSGKRIWVQDIEPNGIHSVTLIAKICDSNEHAPANAQLIAQAPRLYEACKEALEKSHNPVVETILMEALAKAEVKDG